MGIVTSDWKLDLLITTFTLCIFVYYKIKSIYSYFEKRNIKYVKPKFLLGSEPDSVLFKVHLCEGWDRIYKKLKNEKYGGFYQAISPMLMIRDPEYVNDILKKSFDHFTDRTFEVDEKTNPLDENLFFIGGNKWRFLRFKMSPLFSQVKLKWMYEEIEKCAKKFDECMVNFSDGKDLDMKDLLARCTTDVIASCAFGIEPQSLKNPDWEFRKAGKDFFDPNKISQFLTYMRFAFPRLMTWLKIKTMSTQITHYFLFTTKNILQQRRSGGIVRKDFIHLLLELKDKGTAEIDTREMEKGLMDQESLNQKIELTDNLLAAQTFLFYLAGFETTSSTLYFTFHYLARHQEIQERARKEVKEVIAKYGHFTFDSLKELKFLNNCICETLRMYPPLPFLVRQCVKDYTLPDGTVIEKGVNLAIPAFSIHHDPKYFPEPKEYKPDRFDNPPTKGTYLPFGDGPRICIGKRFAEAVMSNILARSLEKYKFELSPMNKHKDEISLNPKQTTTAPINGFLLRIHKLDGSS